MKTLRGNEVKEIRDCEWDYKALYKTSLKFPSKYNGQRFAEYTKEVANNFYPNYLDWNNCGEEEQNNYRLTSKWDDEVLNELYNL